LEHVIYFLISFVITYFGRSYLFKKNNKVSKRSNKKEKKKDNMSIEIKYLSSKFSLNRDSLNTEKMNYLISAIDASIIATAFTLVSFIDDMVVTFIVGIITVFVLIYVSYEILGKILKKKGIEKK